MLWTLTTSDKKYCGKATKQLLQKYKAVSALITHNMPHTSF